MVFVAVTARQMVSARLARAQEMTVPLADRFRRAFSAEAAIGVVVLMLSGWLLALTPPRIVETDNANYPVTVPFVDEATGIDIDVKITPASVGRNGIRVEVMAPEQISNLVLPFVPPVGSSAPPVEQSIPNLTTVGAAVLRASDGIPLDDSGTWTIQLSVVTATGALTGATSSFEVSPADDGTGTSVAPSVGDRRPERLDDGRDGDVGAGGRRHDPAHRHGRRLIAAARSSGRQQVLEAHRRGDVELVVATTLRRAVRAPALELHAVAEATRLELTERHLDDPLDADRHPRQVLAGVPAAPTARHPAIRVRLHLGPVPPRVTVERVVGERLELVEELGAERDGEAGRDTDVVEATVGVVQSEQQRADALAVLVDAVAGHRAVGGALVLDLHHRALVRRVHVVESFGDDTVEPGTLERREPRRRRHRGRCSTV